MPSLRYSVSYPLHGQINRWQGKENQFDVVVSHPPFRYLSSITRTGQSCFKSEILSTGNMAGYFPQHQLAGVHSRCHWIE